MQLKPSWKAEESRGAAVWPGSIGSLSCLAGETGEGRTCRRPDGKKKQIQVMPGNGCGDSQPWVSLPELFWGKSQSEKAKSPHQFRNLSWFRHHTVRTRAAVCSWCWTHPKKWRDFLNGACHGASSSAWLNSFINYVTNTIWMESKPGELGLDWKNCLLFDPFVVHSWVCFI